MGWTTFYRDREPMIDTLNRELTGENEAGYGWRTIGHSCNRLNRSWLIQESYGPDKPVQRFAVEVLTQHYRGYGHNFGYKPVDESMGPVDTDIPMRLFAMLDGYPPTGGYSANWRERVRARNGL